MLVGPIREPRAGAAPGRDWAGLEPDSFFGHSVQTEPAGGQAARKAGMAQSFSTALVIGVTLAVMATLLHAQQSTPGGGAYDGRPATNAPLTSGGGAHPHRLPAIR